MKKLMYFLLFTTYIVPSLGMERFAYNEKLRQKAGDYYLKVRPTKTQLTEHWFDAVNRRDIEKVHSLCEWHLVNARDSSDRTALHIALENGESQDAPNELIKTLLKHNAHPNVLDHQGFTPLHLAFQACATARQSYQNTMKVSERIQRDIIHENYTSNEERAELFAQLTRALDEVDVYQRKVTSYYVSISLLLKHGARGNIVNSKNKVRQPTVKKLWRNDLEYYQYLVCAKATFKDQDTRITCCLEDGMHPGLRLEGATFLRYAISRSAHKCIRTLLYHGAKLTTKFQINEHTNVTFNAIQYAALHSSNEILNTVLESPHGPATRRRCTHDLTRMKKGVFSFLCCASHPDSHEALTVLDIQHQICSYLLPSLSEVVQTIPLAKLKAYTSIKLHKKNFYPRNALVNALTDRHIQVIENILNSPCSLPAPFNRPIHEVVRIKGPEDQREFMPPNAFSQSLDPALSPLKNRRETIKANYTALLENNTELPKPPNTTMGYTFFSGSQKVTKNNVSCIN